MPGLELNIVALNILFKWIKAIHSETTHCAQKMGPTCLIVMIIANIYWLLLISSTEKILDGLPYCIYSLDHPIIYKNPFCSYFYYLKISILFGSLIYLANVL